MSNYLQNILKANISNPFGAAYVTPPLSAMPDGCTLPDAPGAPIDLPAIDSPAITKACAPLFVELPVLPSPFAPPENCINGISFNTKRIGIFSTTVATAPTAYVEVGASQTTTDLCTFDLNIPDIVIPCFPNGPSIVGALTFKTTDNIVLADSLSLNNSTPCSWNIDQQIDLPIPFCDGGISYKSDIAVDIQGGTPIPSTVPWIASRTYAVGEKHIDAAHTLHTVTVGGIAGLVEPTWGLTVGAYTIDGAVTWQATTLNVHAYAGISLLSWRDYLSSIGSPPADNTDCGAVLTGSINLNLPEFTTACSALTVGANSPVAIKLYGESGYDGTGNRDIALQAETCGFGFVFPTINLPVIPCPTGYSLTTDADTVDVGDATKAIVTVKDTDGGAVTQTSPLTITPTGCGFTITGHVTVPVAGGGTVTVATVFRGEYDPTTAYAPQDIVVIRSGSNAGSFVCIAANTGAAPVYPDTGSGYWLSLSNSQAQWL